MGFMFLYSDTPSCHVFPILHPFYFPPFIFCLVAFSPSLLLASFPFLFHFMFLFFLLLFLSNKFPLFVAHYCPCTHLMLLLLLYWLSQNTPDIVMNSFYNIFGLPLFVCFIYLFPLSPFLLLLLVFFSHCFVFFPFLSFPFLSFPFLSFVSFLFFRYIFFSFSFNSLPENLLVYLQFFFYIYIFVLLYLCLYCVFVCSLCGTLYFFISRCIWLPFSLFPLSIKNGLISIFSFFSPTDLPLWFSVQPLFYFCRCRIMVDH